MTDKRRKSWSKARRKTYNKKRKKQRMRKARRYSRIAEPSVYWVAH